MEELGIGRPSTYASILQVLKDRGYVRIDKKRLVPEDKGRVLTAFLESFFARYVEYDFTADLEEQLDRISNNEIAWRELLRDFWRDFTAAVGDIKDLRIAQVIDALDEMLAPHLFPPRADGTDPRKCPNCETGRLSLKLGKFGAFIGCSNYPECRYTRQLSAGNGGNGDGGMKKLGEDPATGLDVTLRSGRFGPYLQLGEGGERREAQARRPARRGCRPTTSISTRALGAARRCRARSASIPRTASRSSPASAASAPTSSTARPTPTSTRATTCSPSASTARSTLIAEKKAKVRARAASAPIPAARSASIRDKGGPVVVKNGRYGPYVSHDGVNATLPADMTPETVTLEQALPLLDARAARGGGRKKAAGEADKRRRARRRRRQAAERAEGRQGEERRSKAGAEDRAEGASRKRQGRQGRSRRPTPTRLAVSPAECLAFGLILMRTALGASRIYHS